MAGQVWVTNSLGGHLTSPELSRRFRVAAQPLLRMRQFTRPEEEFGQNRGDTLQFDKASNIATAGRQIAETELVPESNITLYKDQVVAAEYSNSIPYTWTLQILAKLDVNSILIEALKNDMAKTLDKRVATEFQNAFVVYTPTGTEMNKAYQVGTNQLALAAATRGFSVWDLKNVVDLMKATYFMPLWDGANYMCVASTTWCRGIKDDNEWAEASKYGDPERLFSGETGRLYGLRIAEETNSLNGNLAGGLGEALFFGSDPVVEIAVYPEEIQAKIGTDYGRDKGLRWVWVGGFRITWQFTTEGDARIVRVFSL